MVANPQRFRWDFIGLSTDTKPTPATSNKVVDGSTFYCSDTSKLYVFCKDTWYERKPLGGGGGGGTSYTAGSGITIDDDIISVDTTTIQEKLTAGSNVTISEDGTISATDTTYSNFTGTDGTVVGTAGLVPAPATTDAGKFLKADGTWDTAGGGSSVTVVQTTGTSTTDVMSQNAVTSMVFADPSTRQRVQIGSTDSLIGDLTVAIGIGAYARGEGSVSIGEGTQNYVNGIYSVNIGLSAKTGNSSRAVAIGCLSEAANNNSVAIGTNAKTTREGEVNVGAGTSGRGYNSTNYRVIGGVHDGQELHDAATVAQGNTLSASAPDSSTAGVLGQLWTDTTNMHTYQCTAISGDTYTWTQRW